MAPRFVVVTSSLDADHEISLAVARLLAHREGMNADDVRIVAVPERDTPSEDNLVDLVVEVEGERWAIEHTQVETYENQLQDDARLRSLVDPIRDAVSSELPVGHYTLVVPIGVVDGIKGRELETLRAEITAAIEASAEALCEEGKAQQFVRKRVDVEASIEGIELQYRPPYEPGDRSFNVGRWSLDEIEDERRRRLERALRDKVPKLTAAIEEGDAERSVLVLEDADIALSNPWLIQHAIEEIETATTAPDWTVVVLTATRSRYATVIFESEVSVTEKVVTLPDS